MRNFQYVVNGNNLHLLMSADVFSDFYVIDKEWVSGKYPIINKLVDTSSVPVLYRSVDLLADGLLTDSDKSSSVRGIIAMNHQPGRFNFDNTLVTYVGMFYNYDRAKERFSENCLVIPLIGKASYNRKTDEHKYEPLEIGAELSHHISDDEYERSYYLRALLILDLELTAPIPDNLSVLADILSTGNNYKSLVKYIPALVMIADERVHVEYHERHGVGVYLLNGEEMSVDDVDKYAPHRHMAYRVWERDQNENE